MKGPYQIGRPGTGLYGSQKGSATRVLHTPGNQHESEEGLRSRRLSSISGLHVNLAEYFGMVF